MFEATGPDTLLVHNWRDRAAPHHSASLCSYSSLRSRLLFSCKVSPAKPYIAIRRPPAGTLKQEAEKSPVTQGTHNSSNLLASAKGAHRGPKLTSHHRLRYSCSTVTHQPVTHWSPSDNIFWICSLTGIHRTKEGKDLWCSMQTP